ASIPEVMDDSWNVFQITDEEALLINEVIENVMKDDGIVALIINNIDNNLFLETYRNTLKQRIVNYYLDHNWDERLFEGPYVSPGGIIEYIVQAVFRLCRSKAA
ncbi:MAG TPA: hypothetical protein PKY97_00360, partial [Saprospiraceae bacterium]|nr:hypothetical protein [Saprospiraceae bacterium]